MPRLGRIRITEIRKRDIVLLLDEIALRGPTMANRTRALLSRIFSWAVSRDMLEHNPVTGVGRPGRERSRERVLTPVELRAVWHACEEDSSLAAPMLQFMILTAQRGGEIRAMRWQDISGSWWTIPRAKNGQSHRVFLTDQVFRVLDGLDPETEYVLPAPRGNTGYLTRPHKAVTKIAATAGGAHWTMHDLRRTAATMMTSMGISPFIVERILGHTDKRITAVYDRSSYDREKQEAMVRWGKRVEELVA